MQVRLVDLDSLQSYSKILANAYFSAPSVDDEKSFVTLTIFITLLVKRGRKDKKNVVISPMQWLHEASLTYTNLWIETYVGECILKKKITM